MTNFFGVVDLRFAATPEGQPADRADAVAPSIRLGTQKMEKGIYAEKCHETWRFRGDPEENGGFSQWEKNRADFEGISSKPCWIAGGFVV